jgi:hypothetical protein
MSDQQLELIRVKPPAVAPDDVLALLGTLDQQGWLSAAEIGKRLLWSDRKIRAVANASEGQVISGQSGYKLTSQATIAEIQHAAGWLRHQAKEMTHRALEIDRVYYGKIATNVTRITAQD